jgi:hypothetical protein
MGHAIAHLALTSSPAQPCWIFLLLPARQASLNHVLFISGYNPMQSGSMRQGRIPKRYIVRMKKTGKDIDSAIIRCG